MKGFFYKLAKSELHAIESKIMPMFFSDEVAVRRYYKKKSHGGTLDLNNPITFSQKLQWYKLNVRSSLMQQCADKYDVREYVNRCGLGDLLNDIYFVYDSVKAIDFEQLPDSFVLKATHGSGMNFIVKDKSTLDKGKACLLMQSWLRQDISWSGREWVYKDLKKRIIAEKYLEDEYGELRDYKFFCFHGEPVFVQLESGRYEGTHIRNFYDMKWDLQPFGKGIPSNPSVIIPKPIAMDKMVEAARRLSKPFQFVRADFYEIKGQVYFGELTFFPAGGAPDFIPEKYDEIVGRYWRLTHDTDSVSD